MSDRQPGRRAELHGDCGVLRAWLGAALLVGGLGGCAPARPPVAQASPPTAADPPPATTLMALRPRQGTVHIEASGTEPRQAAFRLEPIGARWQYLIADWRRIDLALDADRSVLTTRVEERAEGVAVEYDPPLVSVPAALAPDRPFRGACRIRVLRLDSGREQDAGTCHYTVALVGPRRVDTPTGPEDAWIIRTAQTIRLRLATSEVLTESTCVPGRGAVLETVRQTTRALGLLSLAKSQTIGLVRETAAESR